ncbi:MAG TPA: DNA-binding protein WhiA [Clostridiaceae bacterium]|nr:DNA-binding protein WhiA [Clostridiaceae bacterium]
MSFSSDLRTEAVERLQAAEVSLERVRALILHASGRRTPDGYQIETRHKAYADWLNHTVCETSWTVVESPGTFRFLVEADYPLETALRWLRTSDNRGDAFALLFAACGAMADPARTSHLEYRIKNQVVAASFIQAAGQHDIWLSSLSEKSYVRLYTKDSAEIGDMLIHAGAMRAYIRYSQFKVDKEVLNNVNRQVNCDRANARRVADSSMAQAEAVRRLDETVGLHTLPETLEMAARARLAHPDLSLSELGSTMTPPIGKSGMNHRMKKLIALAAELA